MRSLIGRRRVLSKVPGECEGITFEEVKVAIKKAKLGKAPVMQ